MRRFAMFALGLALLTNASPAQARTAPQIQAWLYPGSPGDPQCKGASEYHDGRLRTGTLKPEYWAVRADGTLEQHSGLCNGPESAADVKAWSARQYATVSAMDTPTVRALVSSSAKRSAAITKMVNLIKSIGFTGVDVDFEDFWSWTSTDRANYEKFLRELATALHAAGKKLQADAPAMVEDADFYSYSAVVAAGVDELVVMAYDDEYDSVAGSKCLPIQPFEWTKTLVAYARSQVSDDNLVIGLPSYGYSAPTRCDSDKIEGNIALSVMRTKPGFTTSESRRDPSSGEIRWTSGGKLYDYVDQKAMDQKLALLTSLGVTKVSVWSLGGNPWFSR
ncbi:glycosyl hydrolase family 18 protein [Nonomuraea sediminis]|uniref:glycosyl hydrolase family 18 protein n=1 Tax=Nonomuraea sediminis TaxID=2835864 RepID=UPI001BDD0D27|nr:glycosyl hydrolase family 18 protein [Nonomuraea sediminis]